MENEVIKDLKHIKNIIQLCPMAESCTLIYAQQNFCVITLCNPPLTEVPPLPFVGYFSFPQLESFPKILSNSCLLLAKLVSYCLSDNREHLITPPIDKQHFLKNCYYVLSFCVFFQTRQIHFLQSFPRENIY